MPEYINVNGRLMDLSTPRVMAIVNVTPDSFFAGSRTQTEADIARRVEQALDEGASILDLGGYSSRPGAADVSPEEEMARLRRGLEVIRHVCPDAVVSVDTFRADVARRCVEEYGVAHCDDRQLTRIPKEYVVGMRRNKFGVDVLIRSKEKFAQRFPEIFMDAASIEEILLFEARGEKI